MKIKHCLILLSLCALFACKDDLSTEQFFATVKPEYVSSDTLLTFKKVEIKSLKLHETRFLKLSAYYQPQPDENGCFRIPKGYYEIKVKATVTYTDRKGVEQTGDFHDKNHTFQTGIGESGVIRIPLQKGS